MLEELEENQELLRFDKKYVIVSEIADQYYCEKKVDLKNIHGDIDTESKILGRELHEVITEGFEQVRLKERWEVTFKSKLVLISESLFVAKVDDIYFLFKPDGILFEHGIPRLLIEFKFSKYHKPFLSYHVQLRTEALLLNRIGFNTNNLPYCIIISPPEIKGNTSKLNQIPKEIYRNLRQRELEDFQLSFGETKAHIYQYDENKAKKELIWALKYWKDEREAQLPNNKNKCRSCVFNNFCNIN